MSDTSTDDIDRPDGWPEHYMGEPATHCTHYMMWDTAEGVYQCIYECGKTAEEPPAGKVDPVRNRGEE